MGTCSRGSLFPFLCPSSRASSKKKKRSSSCARHESDCRCGGCPSASSSSLVLLPWNTFWERPRFLSLFARFGMLLIVASWLQRPGVDAAPSLPFTFAGSTMQVVVSQHTVSLTPLGTPFPFIYAQLYNTKKQNKTNTQIFTQIQQILQNSKHIRRHCEYISKYWSYHRTKGIRRAAFQKNGCHIGLPINK